MFEPRPFNPAFGFVKQRPTVLDELPLDVIRVYIFPRLDYESRIQLNRCLPPCDRLSKKMDRASVERHDRITTVATVKQYLYKLEWVWTPNDRYKIAIKMFSLFFKPRYLNLVRHERDFRSVLLEKLDSLKGPHQGYHHHGLYADIDITTRLVKTMKRLKRRVLNTPFENDVVDRGQPLVFV
jgi:hypothetical protein